MTKPNFVKIASLALLFILLSISMNSKAQLTTSQRHLRPLPFRLYDLNFRKNPELFPKKPIILTFDDAGGNKSHHRHVFPLLRKYGFKATFLSTRMPYPKK